MQILSSISSNQGFAAIAKLASITATVIFVNGCNGSSTTTAASGHGAATADTNNSGNPGSFNNGDTQAAGDTGFCEQFSTRTDSYFCEDFTGTSPDTLIGLIPPMSFRDQTYRKYTGGELFNLTDPTADTHKDGVIDLHTDLVDGVNFSNYAAKLAGVSEKWDITAHSRDGFIEPGTGGGFNDPFWWNESFLMGDHGIRCGKPIDLSQQVDSTRNNQRGFTFIEQFFTIPSQYDGNENNLSLYWSPEFEGNLTDASGLHPILRYEDMIYVCADHLMTAAYGRGASKLTLTPNHLLDTTSGSGVVEFSVSTYRTAGRDYWQIDLTPLETHLQLPEGDVVADANGKAINGFNINTSLDEGANGIADIMGTINVFRSLMMKNGLFMIDGKYFDPAEPGAEFKRAQIANPGNPERLELYADAPEDEDWVITHTSYNQVMYDYLNGQDDPDITLHNVTDNRTRARFRLSVLKTPTESGWSAQPEKWDQVSLCMPDYGNGCVGEYIVPELPNELLVQFTHYAYNTTKSCSENVQQPHDKPGAAFQSLCHPNTYHWDNFYLSPGKPFTIIKAQQRTQQHRDTDTAPLIVYFDGPAPANSKLRFNALTAGTGNDAAGETTIEVSFDQGGSWHQPTMQPEPENNFDKFRSYYTGAGINEYIPAGVNEVWFRADNAKYRNEYWIRDAALWAFP